MSIKEHYEEVSRHYNSQDKTIEDFVYEQILQKSKETQILDVGCGQAYLLLKLMKAGYSYLNGLDIAAHYGERLVPWKAIEFSQGDVLELPYKSNTFEIVTSVFVLEHITGPFRALGEIQRVMKKKGLLFLAVPNSSWITRVLYPDKSSYITGQINNRHISSFDKTQLSITLKYLQFEIRGFWGFGSLFPRYHGLGKLCNFLFRNKDHLRKYILIKAQKMS